MFKYSWVWDKAKGGNIMTCKYQPYKIHEDIIIFSKSPASFTKSNNRMSYFPIMEPQTKRNGKNYSKSNIVDEKWQIEGFEKSYEEKYPKSILRISNADRKGMTHPTQKPVALMQYLIKTYTNEGETVLDNCMGSGTCGVACKNLNRNFIGIEKDEKYFEIGVNRVLNHNVEPIKLTLDFERNVQLKHYL